MIKFSDNLKFETFHVGILNSVATLAKNKITMCKYWSMFGEFLQYLKILEIHNKKIFLEQAECMATVSVGKPIYTPDVISRAFDNIRTSQALYSKLTKDYYQLSSVHTLTRITSKLASQDDTLFLSNLLSKVKNWQQKCIIMIDEGYIKSALLYHGGTLFGKSANHPDKLAKTMLAYMVKCLYGGPEFLTKMLPVCKLEV